MLRVNLNYSNEDQTVEWSVGQSVIIYLQCSVCLSVLSPYYRTLFLSPTYPEEKRKIEGNIAR
jgi:hypothetical protein